MQFTIFYAWQSDRNEKTCRFLIRDAAKDAIKALGNDAEIEDSPRLDSDTQGVAGHPELARTIFGKIDEAAIFLADLTFTGSASTHDGRNKQVANANVLLELGHASARMGWERMVLVMNKSFGAPEEQLFDIIHRRHPTAYELTDDNESEVPAAKKQLTEKLKGIFKASLASRHDKVAALIRRLDVHCVRTMRKYGSVDFFSGPNPNEYVLGAPSGLDTPAFTAAIGRLLDLNMIHSDFAGELYAYHWTYWGKEALKSLKFRQ